MMNRITPIALAGLLLAGCFNGGNNAISLGDVSIGQQLIDLKRALDEGVIARQEFDDTKQTLLQLNTVCGNTREED